LQELHGGDDVGGVGQGELFTRDVNALVRRTVARAVALRDVVVIGGLLVVANVSKCVLVQTERVLSKGDNSINSIENDNRHSNNNSANCSNNINININEREQS
jgi:hypothetical protein